VNKIKILVVDDAKSIRDTMRLALVNAGYAVTLAEDAVVAGRLVLEQHPDLIVVDVNMPYMDGYEFVGALKGDAETRDIPVVFLSASHDVEERASDLGAVAWLHKPVLADKLLTAVALAAKKIKKKG
jgi:two-component system chemotaxis response regulator CheY